MNALGSIKTKDWYKIIDFVDAAFVINEDENGCQVITDRAEYQIGDIVTVARESISAHKRTENYYKTPLEEQFLVSDKYHKDMPPVEGVINNTYYYSIVRCADITETYSNLLYSDLVLWNK